MLFWWKILLLMQFGCWLSLFIRINDNFSHTISVCVCSMQCSVHSAQYSVCPLTCIYYCIELFRHHIVIPIWATESTHCDISTMQWIVTFMESYKLNANNYINGFAPIMYMLRLVVLLKFAVKYLNICWFKFFCWHQKAGGKIFVQFVIYYGDCVYQFKQS